jgi:hypothetical protein
MQYFHLVGYAFIHNINFHIRFYVFVFLISDVVAPLPVAIEGVHQAKDGPKFAYNIDGCDVSYTTKYNSVWHLWVCHNVTMELSKPGRPSTWEQGLKVQDHVAMNAWVLNNP